MSDVQRGLVVLPLGQISTSKIFAEFQLQPKRLFFIAPLLLSRFMPPMVPYFHFFRMFRRIFPLNMFTSPSLTPHSKQPYVLSIPIPLSSPPDTHPHCFFNYLSPTSFSQKVIVFFTDTLPPFLSNAHAYCIPTFLGHLRLQEPPFFLGYF